LKTRTINEEAKENEIKNRPAEEMKAKKSQKRKICHRCSSKSWIRYNCKRTTTNPNHYAETCWNPMEEGLNQSKPQARGRGQSTNCGHMSGF